MPVCTDLLFRITGRIVAVRRFFRFFALQCTVRVITCLCMGMAFCLRFFTDPLFLVTLRGMDMVTCLRFLFLCIPAGCIMGGMVLAQPRYIVRLWLHLCHKLRRYILPGKGLFDLHPSIDRFLVYRHFPFQRRALARPGQVYRVALCIRQKSRRRTDLLQRIASRKQPCRLGLSLFVCRQLTYPGPSRKGNRPVVRRQNILCRIQTIDRALQGNAHAICLCGLFLQLQRHVNRSIIKCTGKLRCRSFLPQRPGLCMARMSVRSLDLFYLPQMALLLLCLQRRLQPRLHIALPCRQGIGLAGIIALLLFCLLLCTGKGIPVHHIGIGFGRCDLGCITLCMYILCHTVYRLHGSHLYTIPVNGKLRRVQKVSGFGISFFHTDTDGFGILPGQRIRHRIVLRAGQFCPFPADQMLMSAATAALAAMIHSIIDDLTIHLCCIDRLVDFVGIRLAGSTRRCSLQHGRPLVLSFSRCPCVSLTQRIGLCAALLPVCAKIIGQHLGQRLILIIYRTDLFPFGPVLIVQRFAGIQAEYLSAADTHRP